MFRKLFSFSVIVFLLPVIAVSADALLFETKQLQIEDDKGNIHEFTVEIADTQEKQLQGLKYRKHIPENNGMLFLFEKEQIIKMWMKDTYIPLDILFIKSDGSILNIAHKTTPLSLETILSAGKVIAVLELNAGICKKLGIKSLGVNKVYL